MSLELFVIIVILLVSLYALNKIRKIHLFLYAQSDKAESAMNDQYRQMEVLLGLYVDLGLTKSLPSTRGWAASPDFLMELVKHALRDKPQMVVECSSGTSTLVLARCMQLNGSGKVFSLEHDAKFAQQTSAELVRHGLSEFAEVIVAPLEPYSLEGEGWHWYAHRALSTPAPIDMLVIDGPPSATGDLARFPAGPLLFPKLADNATVFLDDAARDAEQSILARWKRDFPMLGQKTAYCEKGCAILQKGVAA